jgi:hypothetical protein
MIIRRSLGAAVLVCALAVYCMTAYPTITWWDSSNYSLASATLGVASPPGSLLLTLLGWPVARLSSPLTTARTLNYLAAAIAAATVVMVYALALRLIDMIHDAERNRGARRAVVTCTGAALGALTFAFTTTLWDYAVRFTPYILSALFTTFILGCMLAWWHSADRPSGTRWIFVLAFLFGLDFSVHRTNALLIPGAMAWVLIRWPRALSEARAIAAAAGGLVAGLLIQLFIIPLAAFSRSALDFNDPSNFRRFWDYIALKRLGGGFLLQLFPRNSNLVSVQSADLLRVLGDNFVGFPGAHGVLGPLPAVLAVIGLAAIWRRRARLAAALLVVLVLQILGTILYFNIPANYFRTFDRHYLPICVITGVLMAAGFATIYAAVASSVKRQSLALAAAGVIFVVIPVIQASSQWREHDASQRFFAHDWAVNSLQDLPPHAIYLTFGDNDTFPVMYVQAVEGLRRDVRIINQSIAHAPDYIERSRRRDPRFPLSVTITPDSLALHPGDRPITYAATIASAGATNAAPLRVDGLYWRVVADSARRMNLDLTRANILERPSYRGFADRRVVVDDATRSMAYSYYEAAKALLVEEHARGLTAQCRVDQSRFLTALPFDRLSMPASYRTSFMATCGD